MAGASEPRKGRAFEYKVRDYLRANGYWVMRSPASRSVVDMVAIKTGQVLFVQCKVNGRLDPAEWNALYEAAKLAGALPVMAERPGRGTIAWWCLLSPKRVAGARQPMAPLVLDEAGDAGL
jgi:Holliday junction resolvase